MDRFWTKVDRRSDDECWLWTSATSKSSSGFLYGDFWFEGRQVAAHRFAYTLCKGTIPEGNVIMHKCDVPLCCNPSHLQAGSFKDNSIDCLKKGRTSNKKLTEIDVFNARKLVLFGMSDQQIGTIFGVTRVAIRELRLWRWQHVPWPEVFVA